MRIVHFSDWHDDWFPLPPADVYVCTGDMLPNFRIYDIQTPDGQVIPWESDLELLGETTKPRPPGKVLRRAPLTEREVSMQTRYLQRLGAGYARKLMASRDAPVVCVRGNHDYVDLEPLFVGGPVFEIGEEAARWRAFSVGLDVIFGGVRGVKYHHGNWSDELSAFRFADRANRLPRNLSVLVTHAPPEGILDDLRGEPLGSAALRSYVSRHRPDEKPLLAHLFGHIHEQRGRVTLGGTLFSNAARGWHELDLGP